MKRVDGLDYWFTHPTNGLPCCSYCGSLHPDVFMAKIEMGDQIDPSTKNYKVYVSNPHQKFYWEHLSVPQRKHFVELFNEGTVKMQTFNTGAETMQFNFDPLPFFMSR